jgi:hypothetical protein
MLHPPYLRDGINALQPDPGLFPVVSLKWHIEKARGSLNLGLLAI